MSYLVTETTGNGYHCSCCGQTWSNTFRIDDIDDAYSHVPTIVKLGARSSRVR